MDIKEKLRLIHASCFYGVGLSPNDRRDMIKEAEEIMKTIKAKEKEEKDEREEV